MTYEDIEMISANRVVMYTCIVYTYRPQNEDPNCARLATGWTSIDCPFDWTTQPADITTSKIMWNSVPTSGGRYAVENVKNIIYIHWLTAMNTSAFQMILSPLSLHKNIIHTPRYKIGMYVCMWIVCGLYNLTQAGMLANNLLKERLER